MTEKTEAAPGVEPEDEAVWAEAIASAEGAAKEESSTFRVVGDTEPDADRSQDAAEEPGEGAEAAEGEDGDDDPWATAPEALRTQFEELRREKERAEQQFKSQRGRLLAYERELAEARARQERAQTQTRERPAEEPAKEPAPDRLATLREEYPEIAEPLIEALSERDATITEMRDALNEIRSEREAQAQGRLHEEAATLEQQHPDYQSFLAGRADEFRAWVEDQPRTVREAAYRNADNVIDAAEAASVIAAFKQHLGVEAPRQQQKAAGTGGSSTIADRRARQLRASGGVRTTTRPAANGIPKEGDPDQMWESVVKDVERRGLA